MPELTLVGSKWAVQQARAVVSGMMQPNPGPSLGHAPVYVLYMFWLCAMVQFLLWWLELSRKSYHH